MTLPARALALLRALSHPPRGIESLAWLLVGLTALGLRLYLCILFPSYGWTHDSWDYLKPAFQWAAGQPLISDVRRGPIYSGFVGLILKLGGSLWTVVLVQHVLGALTVVALTLALRALAGRAAWLPTAACGFALALYAVPIHTEHLLRNETLLMVFSAMAFAGLALAHDRGRSGFFLSGLGLGLVTVTKSLFHPFAPFAIAGILWSWRRRLADAASRIGLFLLGFGIPLLAVKTHHMTSASDSESASYAGIQLYGRVGQWTVLDRGAHPDIKALIREPVLQYQARYRATGDLDNNDFIKRLVIEPVIKRHLVLQGRSYAELDRICRNLAFEAIAAHPSEAAAQFWRDFTRLHWRYGRDPGHPKTESILDDVADMESMRERSPFLDVPAVAQRLRSQLQPDTFAHYHALTQWAWLFDWWPPVLATSLVLPFLFASGVAPGRPFWLTAAAVWFFNMILFSTVGKPLHRYTVPLAPIMFFALGMAVCSLWNVALGSLLRRLQGPPPPDIVDPDGDTPASTPAPSSP